MRFVNLLVALSLSAWDAADGTCANMCSGHGTCGAANKCTCFANFMGADCSRRACPKGIAWSDKALAANTAHSMMECSNRGTCDYIKGVCTCADGFAGDACQRSVCLNSCSGHGMCQSTAMMALAHGRDTGTGSGPAYTNWEANSMMACFCDYGYQGPDCSLRMCPKNDDPLTTGQTYRSVVLTVAGAGSALAGTVTFTFNGRSVTMPANGNANSNAICAAAISSLSTVGSATCVQGAIDGTTGGASYTITFTSWPLTPVENNVFTHDGNPALSQFSCNVLGVTSSNTPSCSLVDGNTANLVEYAFCSNRGICDFATGLCTCFMDYKAIDCNQPSNIPDNLDQRDGFLIEPTGTTFQGTALRIHTIKGSATDFQMVQIEASAVTLFYMDGAGHTYWNTGNVRIQSGTLFVQSGATIQTGGLQVVDGGATVSASAQNAAVLGLVAGHASYTSNVLLLQATRAGSSAFNLIAAYTSGLSTAVFDVRGDGRTTVRRGGFEVLSGGATITDTTTATTTTTVQSTNAAFTGTVLSVLAATASAYPATDYFLLKCTASSTVAFAVESSGRTTISNGGASVTNQDPTAAALTVTSTDNAFGGTVATIQTSRAANTGFYLLEAKANNIQLFSVHGSGLTKVWVGGFEVVMGGATISNGGLLVDAGGAVIKAGLQVATGGATISTTGLVVEDGGTSITQKATSVHAAAVYATDAAFTKALLYLATTAATAPPSFYILQAEVIVGTPIFDIQGTGDTTLHQGNLVVSTGTASIAGAVTASSTLHVVGATALDSTLAVTGAP
ncbi:hypothetical protein SDRG_11637 [Saprolegnia diclina VS20]|uniref:EGF-like domain-containing protein n=1 Tax=Saprolegnia diclina (strain VS20) TaxID=1156394 RepID=T0PYG0_SAPDV|nr:hypothetical protein SDRG_11637 [Saprolegnia diclina VS20]EQC30579.1 hypothetical protein SDRG_11637 [Saprolegnia diclina VS20]|eukprot:XP_008615905.1 hypothetical protein SDRG_11637 [Saprolegnia diclina VS20]